MWHSPLSPPYNSLKLNGPLFPASLRRDAVQTLSVVLLWLLHLRLYQLIDAAWNSRDVLCFSAFTELIFSYNILFPSLNTKCFLLFPCEALIDFAFINIFLSNVDNTSFFLLDLVWVYTVHSKCLLTCLLTLITRSPMKQGDFLTEFYKTQCPATWLLYSYPKQ